MTQDYGPQNPVYPGQPVTIQSTPTPAPPAPPKTVKPLVPPVTATLTLAPSIVQEFTGQTSVITQSSLDFPFSPNDLVFRYQMNKQTFDTYGGRVTQLLSVKIDTMAVTCDAGSRTNLVAYFQGMKNLQEQQIQNRSPLLLTIPATVPGDKSGESGLSFYVWIRSLDIGWDPTTVTYPFSLQLEVEDSSYKGYAQGYATLKLADQALKDLFTGVNSSGVGYSTLSATYAGMYVPAGESVVSPNKITAASAAELAGLGQGNPINMVTGGG